MTEVTVEVIQKPRILIVGGGYSGFYTAWKLEKLLKKGEAEVTMVDPLPYMTYQPFLPEVAAGAIDPRHAIVSHRRHLKRTHIISGRVTLVQHRHKTATILVEGDKPIDFKYDHIVMTAGAITRTFPISGIADNAIGMKTIEEAIEVRDRMIGNFDRASSLPEGSKLRARLLTTVVVGGGFAGIEIFAELRSLATYLLRYHPGIKFDEVKFHLIEAMGRVMPEVSLKTSQWVLKNLAKRGGQVHLDTQLKSADGGLVKMSSGESFEADLIIWTAGVAAHPMAKNTDFPMDDRGRLIANTALQIVKDETPVAGAWTAGDVAAVPDLTGDGVGGFCVPNAQHAVRQGKRLAANMAAALRGELLVNYVHSNLGAVAGLGVGVGVFQFRKLGVTGFVAWLMHRGYHGFAMPTWERKIRVSLGWVLNMFLSREIAAIETTRSPRRFFNTHAAKGGSK